ncbi:hypothetical protein ACWGB8_07935 [Kitasatospora sp. NPDC054939]
MTDVAAVAGGLMVAGMAALVIGLALGGARDGQDPEHHQPTREAAEDSGLIPRPGSTT